MKNKFYISTAIMYTSGKPHIGNTYEIILADSIARFKRQEGYEVYFQTGTDEHGLKISQIWGLREKSTSGKVNGTRMCGARGSGTQRGRLEGWRGGSRPLSGISPEFSPEWRKTATTERGRRRRSGR